MMKNEGLHILVVEDDSNDALFLVRALQKQLPNSSVYVVQDGADAIKYIAGQGIFMDRRKFRQPDLLITDLKMPRVTGFDLLMWMQNHPKFRVTPSLMLSSSDDEKDVARAYELGAAGYMTKPSDLDEWQRIAVVVSKHWEQNSRPQRPELRVEPPVSSLPPANLALPDRMRPRIRFEMGDLEKQSLGCEVTFPSGISFQMNGRDVTSRFQSNNQGCMEVYEGDLGSQEPLPVRIERQNHGPRHCKLRFLSHGRLLHVSHVRRCRTTRESVFELLLPGMFLLLTAYYALIHDPTVGKFYCDKILRTPPAKHQKGTTPRRELVPQKARAMALWKSAAAIDA